MAQLHIWASLLPGWLLFVIFLFCISAFFDAEISQWMRLELSRRSVSARALGNVGTFLSHEAADAVHARTAVGAWSGLAAGALPAGLVILVMRVWET